MNRIVHDVGSDTIDLFVSQEIETPVLLGKVNTTARLTCVAVWKPSCVQEVKESGEEATTSQGNTIPN